MGTTPTYALPYPELSEAADPPADIKELAERLESVLSGIAAVPTGFIGPFGGVSAPPGWLLCDGAAVSRSTYAALFAAVGTAYGAGDGTTTFNTPNLRGKVPVMLDSAQAEFNALGKVGGAKAVALQLAELAAHTHTVNSHSHGGATGTDSPDHGHSGGTDAQGLHSHPGAGGTSFAMGVTQDAATGTARKSVTGPAGTTDNAGSHSHGVSVGGASARHAHGISAEAPGTDSKGSGTAHTNLQPFVVVNAIIKT